VKNLEQLLEGWEAGSLSPEEIAELKRLLATPEARAELVGDWLLHEAIYDALRSSPAETPALAPAQQVAASRAKAAPRKFVPQTRRFRWLVWHEARISWRALAGLAAAACIAFLGVHFYFGHAAVGHLADVRAQVTVERAGRNFVAREGELLYPGDVVLVAARAAAAVAWSDEATRLDLSSETELQVLNPMRGKRLALRAGSLQASVGPQFGWRPMKIFTPQAEVRVVGTVFSLSISNLGTRLEVLEGIVRLRRTLFSSVGGAKEVEVHSGELSEAAADKKLEVHFLTGFLSSDVWKVPSGTPFANAESRGTLLTPFQLPDADANPSAHVERLRGYLIAPADGGFTFWIASFKSEVPTELWLSTDENPAHKHLIARVMPRKSGQSNNGKPAVRPGLNSALEADWNRDPAQKSAPQQLVKDRRYYIEVWHEGAGPRSLAIGWKFPGEPDLSQPSMVDLSALCPFVETSGKHGQTGTNERN